MAYHLADNLREVVSRDGFAVIENLLPLEEVASIKSTLAELHRRNVGFKEGAQFDAASAEAGTTERRFPQILMPSAFAPSLTQAYFRKIGLEIATKVLGPTARFKADISLMKPAQIGSETPWHQDEAFSNPALEYEELSIWVALTPANASNSCMSFIPGSHLSPVLPHRPMGNDPRVHALECVGDFDPARAVECALEPGGATLHLHRTLHYAGPNRSADPRLAYVLIFDTPHRPRVRPVEFVWQRTQLTDRTLREQRWRRHGGILVHAWRQRHRIRVGRLLADFRRACFALREMKSIKNEASPPPKVDAGIAGIT